MSRWLTEDEQRAWRGLLRMTAQLNARMNRQLQDDYGISLADYDVLVVLSEAPAAGGGCSSSPTRWPGSKAACRTSSPGCSGVVWSRGRSA